VAYDADADFTDELATHLFAVDLRDLSTSAVTRAITCAIVRLGHDRGWQVRTEARVEVQLAVGAAEQLGFVDVLISRGGESPHVAIEIDSTDKAWSVVKLQHAAAAGMHAVWVRWGDDAWAGVYDDIDVIQIPTLRKAETRPARSQLTVWS